MDMYLNMKPYPEQVDELVPRLKCYKTTYFLPFFEEDEKSSMDLI